MTACMDDTDCMVPGECCIIGMCLVDSFMGLLCTPP
jgi:hypothetical protein